MVWRGELDEARPWFVQLRAQAIENGDEESAAAMALHLCELELRSGDWQSASRYADETAAYAHFVPLVEAGAESLVASVCAHRGDLTGAQHHADRSIELSQQPGLQLYELLSRVALGAAELSTGNSAAAASILSPLFTLVVERGLDEPGEFPFAPDLIEAFIGCGLLNDAEQPLEWLEARSHEQEHPWGLAVASRCRGLLLASRGDANTAATALQASISRLEKLPLPFELARSQLAFGTALRRDRRRSAARTQLTAAVEGFQRLGARLWTENAQNELSRIGGRTPSPDELTAAQQRVAERAARGRTNREIAAELFVTENTVESHLKQVYAKLGVRSRTELGQRLSGR